MNDKQGRPTDAELEVLQVLWHEGACTVRQVNDQLNRVRPIGYTTTLKMMQLMTEKGFLGREEQGRSHVYQAVLREQPTQKALLDRILETAFGGSAKKLVMQALGGNRTSAEELAEIQAWINQQVPNKEAGHE